MPTYQETCDALDSGKFSSWDGRRKRAGLKSSGPARWGSGRNPNPRRYGDTETAFHYAARTGKLDQIPTSFLTAKALSQLNGNFNSALFCAHARDHCHQLEGRLSLKTLEELVKYYAGQFPSASASLAAYGLEPGIHHGFHGLIGWVQKEHSKAVELEALKKDLSQLQYPQI